MDKVLADIRASGVIAGFVSETAAYRAALRRGLVGLTGSGQECCPVQLADGSWAYWTAHNYFRPRRDPGSLVLPRRVLHLECGRAMAALAATLDEPLRGEIESFAESEGLL